MRTNDDPSTVSGMPASSVRRSAAEPRQVLIVAPDVPYPDDYGGARDMWQRIRLLAGRGHALSLLATYRDEARRAAFESAPASGTFRRRALFPMRPWRGLATMLPYAVGARLLARPAVAAAGFEGTTFDVVEIEGLQALGTFLQVRRRLSYHRALLRLFNRESAFQLNQARSEPRVLRRALVAADAGRFFVFERFGRWKRAVDAGLFISREELDHPSFAGVARRVLVAPPVPVDDVPPALSDDFVRRDDLLLYVGNLRLPDNRAAVRAAHRALRDMLPRHDWRLVVCGRSDDPGALAELRGDPRVRLAFNVTAGELERLYARAKVFIGFSENSAGAKLKLLEPIQRGVPIVATADAVAGSDLAPAVVLWTDGGSEPRRMLVELMTVAERWQAFRVAAYRLWCEVNARAIAEYLRALE